MEMINQALHARTHFENRCSDCMYLVEDDEGNWVCDDCGMKCCEIADDECSANQEW